MLKLKYNLKSTTTKYDATVIYKLKVPKVIIEIIQNTKKNNFNSVQKLIRSKLGLDTQLSDIVKMMFRDFKDLYTNDINSQEVKNVLENGFKTATKTINFNVNLLAPLVELFKVNFDNEIYNLHNMDDMNNLIIQYIRAIKPDAYSINIAIKKAIETKREKIAIQLRIDDDLEWKYKNNTVNENEIDFDSLITLNDLVKDSNFASNNHINSSHQKLTNKLYANFINCSKYLNNKNIDFYYEIMENNIEIYEPRYFGKISIFRRKSILASDFKDSSYYNLFLNEYMNNSIDINKFMITEFIKDNSNFIKKLLIDKSIEKYLLDKDILSILLRSSFEMIINYDLDTNLLMQIVKKASLNQLPLIMRKLTTLNINKINDTKTIMRIGNMDPKFLSKNQLLIFNDKQAKKDKLKAEYISIMGAITLSGIRENRKKLNSKEKKNFKIDKTMIKWINNNIGHNKGDQDIIITQDMVSFAKTILKKAESVNKYLKK